MSLLERQTVRRVREALVAAGVRDAVVELSETARSAQEAADAIGTEVGAIVKTLVFLVGDRAVLALVSGDRKCDAKTLPGVLGLDGKVSRPDADRVRDETGFSIGGVAPVGGAKPLPVAIDSGLGRFETVYAAAGHTHCVFPTTLDDLARMTGGVVSDRVGLEA